ncbi:helix-turn-helix domain-containing protein [Spongiimicrobium salis]|uniref:helix-turn-helix domain-containing protein n=1 Tax=Spongiimicrobium salis TaxID=1667022 RepID=UPI00374C9AD0
MELNYNFISLLDTVGVVQGMTLGTLLIILNKRKYKSTFFLGVLLILFALQRIPLILKDLDFYSYYPDFLRLPFNFFWLLFPVFFIYTQQVSVFAQHKTKYWVLYPGIIAFFIQCAIFILPYGTKLSLTEHIGFQFFIVSGIFYSWAIGIWNLKLLYRHKIEVNNYFSMVESKEMRWARTFLFFFLIGSIAYIVQFYALPENIYSRIFYLIFDLTIIYWLSFHGVVQRNVLSIIAKKELLFVENKPASSENSASAMTIENRKALIKKLDDYMINSESFMHTELTIVDIAEKLKVHPRRISVAINSIHHQNFNTYVNQFRIKKAEVLLADENLNNLSIEGIGLEVGFHSKSAFYSAFKKVTGTTPSHYKKTLIQS